MDASVRPDLSKYKNTWIILDKKEQTVLATGKDLTRAIRRAKNKGEKSPVVVPIQSETGTYFF